MAQAIPAYVIDFLKGFLTISRQILRNFLWRGLTSSLPVGQELLKKHINGDSSCRLCGASMETVNHLFFQCVLAREIWSLPTMSSIFADGQCESLYQNVWDCLQSASQVSASNLEDKQSGPWILWLLWKARNKFIFQQKTTSGQIILQKALSDAQEWLQNNWKEMPSIQIASNLQNTVTSSIWQPPPVSYLKCNVHVSWQDSQDCCGVLWISRDSNGMVKLHGLKLFPSLSSSLEAEATVMVWVVNCMCNMVMTESFVYVNR